MVVERRCAFADSAICSINYASTEAYIAYIVDDPSRESTDGALQTDGAGRSLTAVGLTGFV